jgi:predicted RNA-binding protein associated with RNAse of E/G family
VTQDHVLDLIVDLDGNTHRKDEPELTEAERQGRYTAEDAARFEAAAASVEELVARWESPFRDGWEKWRPDPAWTVPSLPADARRDFESPDA